MNAPQFSEHDLAVHLVDDFGDFWCWDDEEDHAIDSMEAHLDDDVERREVDLSEFDNNPCRYCQALLEVGYLPTQPLTPTEEEEE